MYILDWKDFFQLFGCLVLSSQYHIICLVNNECELLCIEYSIMYICRRSIFKKPKSVDLINDYDCDLYKLYTDECMILRLIAWKWTFGILGFLNIFLKLTWWHTCFCTFSCCKYSKATLYED